MRQIISKSCYATGWGGTTQYVSVCAGDGAFVSHIHPDDESASTPVPFACVIRNLAFYSGVVRGASVTLTLMVNGAASLLTATLGTGDTVVYDEVNEISLSAGDYISMRAVGANVGSPGYECGFSIEIEGIANVYGIEAAGGTIGNGDAYFGGAFGNGNQQQFVGQPNSNTYSICAIIGSITHIALKAFDGAPGAGVWTALVRKNSVLQDGTAGTPDTTTILTGAGTSVITVVACPIAIQDKVDIVLTRTGGTAGFAIAHVAIGIGFTPTTDGQYMFCGGSNDTISQTLTGWKWVDSEQLATTELEANAPVGNLGFRINSLYVELGSATGASKTYGYTIRKNGASTAITLTVSNPDTTGGVTPGTAVEFVRGDVVVLMITPTNTPATGQLHWGVALNSLQGTIVVAKVTDPLPTADRFTVTISPGLLPAVFELGDEESVVFENVPPGSGYVVSEDPKVGWSREILISNESTFDNITVAPGEYVTVLIVNSRQSSLSGIYFIHKGKTNDSLFSLIQG